MRIEMGQQQRAFPPIVVLPHSVAQIVLLDEAAAAEEDVTAVAICILEDNGTSASIVGPATALAVIPALIATTN